MARRAFRQRASQTHPDHGGDARTFQAVQAAWTVLRAELADRPAPRSSPYHTLISPAPDRRDLLETRRPATFGRPGASQRAQAPSAGSHAFASVLDRELARMGAAA
jgi:curved DNA-binding protein CbpA